MTKADLGPHYRPKGLPETWEIIEGWQETWPVDIRYHLGNVAKYLARIGRKKGASVENDLAKLVDYAQRAQKVLQRQGAK